MLLFRWLSMASDTTFRPDDTRNCAWPTAKTNSWGVLRVCEHKFDHVVWNDLITLYVFSLENCSKRSRASLETILQFYSFSCGGSRQICVIILGTVSSPKLLRFTLFWSRRAKRRPDKSLTTGRAIDSAPAGIQTSRLQVPAKNKTNVSNRSHIIGFHPRRSYIFRTVPGKQGVSISGPQIRAIYVYPTLRRWKNS